MRARPVSFFVHALFPAGDEKLFARGGAARFLFTKRRNVFAFCGADAEISSALQRACGPRGGAAFSLPDSVRCGTMNDT